MNIACVRPYGSPIVGISAAIRLYGRLRTTTHFRRVLMSKHSKTSSSLKPITPADVSRIQGAVARTHGGGMPKGGYVGRLQRQVAVPAKPTK